MADGALNPEFEVGDGERERPALQIRGRGDGAVGGDDDLHLVAERAVRRRHHRERDESGTGHRDRVAAGVHAGDVQAPGAHGFVLSGVGLHREEHHLPAGDLGHVLDEPVPDLLVDGGILDRRVGEDDGVGVDPFVLVQREIRGEVAVTVAVAFVEEAAGTVFGGIRGDGYGHQPGPGQGGGSQQSGYESEFQH